MKGITYKILRNIYNPAKHANKILIDLKAIKPRKQGKKPGGAKQTE
jgi:hypothetical protein